MVRVLTVLLTSLALLGALTAPASAATTTAARHPTVDGFRVGHVPAAAGPDVGVFTSTWEDVELVSRVWESGPDAAGAYRQDLAVTVLRGPALADAADLRAFLADYLEEDPRTWARTRYTHRDGPGFRTDHRVFWLVEPGVAAMVRVDARSVDERELRATARSVRPLAPGSRA